MIGFYFARLHFIERNGTGTFSRELSFALVCALLNVLCTVIRHCICECAASTGCRRLLSQRLQQQLL